MPGTACAATYLVGCHCILHSGLLIKYARHICFLFEACTAPSPYPNPLGVSFDSVMRDRQNQQIPAHTSLPRCWETPLLTVCKKRGSDFCNQLPPRHSPRVETPITGVERFNGGDSSECAQSPGPLQVDSMVRNTCRTCECYLSYCFDSIYLSNIEDSCPLRAN
jgi:hypothetical protein